MPGPVLFREYAKESPGKHFDRFDIERVGLFTSPSSISPVKRKVDKKVERDKPENSRFRGAQFSTSPLKTKDGTQDGYFETEFKRIFIKEAIPKQTINRKKKPAVITMVPPSPTKLHSTPGDGYGCFSTFPHFRLAWMKTKPPKKKKEKVVILANCAIGPPGYFSPYPEHFDPRLKRSLLKQKKTAHIDFYLNHSMADYFDPNPYFVEYPKRTYVPVITKEAKGLLSWVPPGNGKKMGGGGFGTFDPYPKAMSAKLKPVPKKPKTAHNYSPYVWANKSLTTPSIVNTVVDKQCNIQNYLDYKPTYLGKQLDTVNGIIKE